MPIPNFAILQQNNVYLYSTCVFWFLDNTYAQNFLYNFSNIGIEDVQDYQKEVALGKVILDTNFHRDQVLTNRELEDGRNVSQH